MTTQPSLVSHLTLLLASALLSVLLSPSSSSAQASGTVVITIEGTFTLPSAPTVPSAPVPPVEAAPVAPAPVAPMPAAAPPAPAPLLAPIPTVVLAPVPTAYGPQSYEPQTYEPSATTALTYAPVEAAPRVRRRWGLVGSGAAMVIAAYALNIGGTLLALALPFSNGHRDQLFGSVLIPVAGPLLQIAYRDADWQIPFYLVSSGLQIAGFVMAFVGTFTTTTVAGSADDATAATLSVVPFASGDGAGLMAAGTF